VSELRGTGPLIRLGVRRDRIALPIWIYGFVAATVGTAKSFDSLYPTAASRASLAAGLTRNPALLVLTGRAFDLQTTGGLTAWRLGSLGGIAIALMNTFTVVRHTRAEEESGRLDLLGATAMGRRAPISAALALAWSADLVIAIVVALGLIVIGLPAAGSIAFGVALATCGISFAAIGALCAQLSGTSRGANGLGGVAVAVAFVLRAIGDSAKAGGPTWASWLTPIGWTQQVRAFAGERWWVVLLPIGFTIVVSAAAVVLQAHRDLGAGVLPDRPGRARGGAWLRGATALSWRLQRGSIVAWTVGVGLLGVAMGSLAEGVADLIRGDPQLEDFLRRFGGGPRDLVDAYLATSVGIVGLVAAAFLIAAVLRLRGEETGGRAEVTLSTALGRLRWACGHLVVAGLGAAAMLAVTGVAAGLADGVRAHDVSGQLPAVLAGAMAQLPAVLVLGGVTALLYGFVPRWSGVAWGVFGLFVLFGQLGPTLRLPQAVLDLSPFTHAPKIPGTAFELSPVVWTSVAALALTATGLVGLRRRDLG
jgi:ABC-2 type transport system permease protein